MLQRRRDFERNKDTLIYQIETNEPFLGPLFILKGDFSRMISRLDVNSWSRLFR